MNERVVQLMTEEADRVGLRLPAALASKLLQVVEATRNDADRRSALRQLTEAIDEALKPEVGGGPDVAH
jgi:hypothetical protein